MQFKLKSGSWTDCYQISPLNVMVRDTSLSLGAFSSCYFFPLTAVIQTEEIQIYIGGL